MNRQCKYPPRQPRKYTTAEEATVLLEEVRETTEDPRIVSAIDSVKNWIKSLDAKNIHGKEHFANSAEVVK